MIMESRILPRRQSTTIDALRKSSTADGADALEAQTSAASSLLKPSAQLTMDRFLQDLPNAEQPPVEFAPQYHTGRVPNSKAGDGKPRLLLMGQRRLVMAPRETLFWLTLRP
jgi:Ras-related GTP-binding protein C/D